MTRIPTIYERSPKIKKIDVYDLFLQPHNPTTWIPMVPKTGFLPKGHRESHGITLKKGRSTTHTGKRHNNQMIQHNEKQTEKRHNNQMMQHNEKQQQNTQQQRQEQHATMTKQTTTTTNNNATCNNCNMQQPQHATMNKKQQQNHNTNDTNENNNTTTTTSASNERHLSRDSPLLQNTIGGVHCSEFISSGHKQYTCTPNS